MLDLEFIRQNQETVKDAISKKGIDLELDEFVKIDDKRRALIQESDSLRERQNAFNNKVLELNGAEKDLAIADMKVLSNDLKRVEEDLRETELKFQQLYLLVPNIPSDDSPVGPDDSANREIKKWGEPPAFAYKPKSHIELAAEFDLIDAQRGAKTSGFRGYYLKNEAAVLHLAVLMYAFNRIRGKGFAPMIAPTILKEFALIGSGHFPFGQDDIYELANIGKDETGRQIGEKLFLAGTSEPALLAYFADQTLDESNLPVRVCAFSQCYRNEVGSYGKETQGIYRLHEFMKVEQVVLCRADEKESDEHLEKMRNYSEEILQDLKLPYRVVQVSTGDMGAGKRKMYDIETWMPSREGYGETHSDSDLTDWQSRRLNIKYKTKNGEKKYVYALNNTVLASPRILIAILENYQNEDGSVTVPEVLVPFCAFDKIEHKKEKK